MKRNRGINLPIHYLGKILGGGDFSVSPPGETICRTSEMTAELIVEQQALLEQRKLASSLQENLFYNYYIAIWNWKEMEQQAKFFFLI